MDSDQNSIMKDYALQGSLLQRFYLRTVSLLQRKLFRNFELPVLFILYFIPKEAYEMNILSRNIFMGLGVLLALIGFLTRFLSRGYGKEKTFVIDGPYRYVQNPDELGSVLLYGGAFFILGVHWSWVLATELAAMCYFFLVSSAYQESLKQRVGAGYEKYSRRVSRWIPSLYPGVNRSGVRFNFKRSLQEDKMLLFWVCSVIVIALLKTL